MAEVHYTVFKHNQANVVGLSDQVYVMDNLADYIVKGIKAGIISAIGTLSVNAALPGIIFHQVHMDLRVM